MKTKINYVDVSSLDEGIVKKTSEIESEKTELKRIEKTITQLEEELIQLRSERLAEIKRQLQQKFPTLEAISDELVIMKENHELLKKEINALEKVVGIPDTHSLTQLSDLLETKKTQANEVFEVLKLSHQIQYELCPHKQTTAESYSLPSRDYYWNQCTICGAKFNEHDEE